MSVGWPAAPLGGGPRLFFVALGVLETLTRPPAGRPSGGRGADTTAATTVACGAPPAIRLPTSLQPAPLHAPLAAALLDNGGKDDYPRDDDEYGLMHGRGEDFGHVSGAGLGAARV